jgi:hypothetical protein
MWQKGLLAFDCRARNTSQSLAPRRLLIHAFDLAFHWVSEENGA